MANSPNSTIRNQISSSPLDEVYGQVYEKSPEFTKKSLKINGLDGLK